MELPPHEVHILRAATGWLELGDTAEALAELEQLSQAAQQHPAVLETRWMILAQNRDWATAATVGGQLLAAAPAYAAAWLHHAYALRRAPGGGLLAAYEALRPAAERFPAEATIPYNLACYTCQMQLDHAETMAWLLQAIERGGRKAIVSMALNDADLAPLHAEIARLAKTA